MDDLEDYEEEIAIFHSISMIIATALKSFDGMDFTQNGTMEDIKRAGVVCQITNKMVKEALYQFKGFEFKQSHGGIPREKSKLDTLREYQIAKGANLELDDILKKADEEDKGGNLSH